MFKKQFHQSKCQIWVKKTESYYHVYEFKKATQVTREKQRSKAQSYPKHWRAEAGYKQRSWKKCFQGRVEVDV